MALISLAEKNKQQEALQAKIEAQEEANRLAAPKRAAELKEAIRQKALEVQRERTFAGFQPTEQTLVAVFRMAGTEAKVIERNEREKIKELSAKIAAIVEKIRAHGSDAARQLFKDQDRTLLDAAREGKDAPPDLYTKFEYQEEVQRRRSAFKTARRELQAELAPICARICARVAPLTEEFARRVEDSEKAECEKFAVPFKPSTLVTTLRSAAFYLEKNNFTVETVLKIIKEAEAK